MSWRAALVCLALIVAPSAGDDARAAPAEGEVLLPNGLALPYPTLRVFRAFGRCRRAGPRPARWQAAWRTHDHEGIDLGGLGPDGGLGSAVRSMTRARVVEIDHGDDLPPKFGITDRREGEAERDGERYPRSFVLAGYGEVHFFTRARGWFRTGNMVVTEGLDGRLAGHVIRYMHLGRARPDLAVGDVLEPGEELGVLGGTAVQDAAPHVHIDIRDRDGEAVDVAPLIGLVTSAWCGVPRRTAVADAKAFAEAAAGKAWRPDRWAPPVGDPTLVLDGARTLPWVDLLRTPAPLVAAGIVPAGTRFWHDVVVPKPCAATVVEEDFSSGAYGGHAWRLHAARGQAFDIEVITQRGATPARFVLVDPAGGRVVGDASGGTRHLGYEAPMSQDVLIAVLSQPEPYRITVTERCR